MRKPMIVLTVLLAISVVLGMNLNLRTVAQSEPTPTPSVYGELLYTEIRGLSPEEIEAYRSGAGAGLALPAELNGYPGPRHVLDLADELQLTEEQRATVQNLFDTMLPQAIALGEQILQAEAELELAFRGNNIDDTFLETQLAYIGDLQAQLRFVHLSTHIATADVLTAEQTEQYNVLRGYSGEGTSEGHHGSH